MSKKALITGATGMIGGLVLKECLDSHEITEIVSLVRKPCGLKHAKLKEIIHSNFTDYSSVEAYFKNVDVVYFCIGVYTGTVSRNEFRIITVDYTVEFAKALKKHSPNATFCFLSGAGADQSEKSRMMFAKDKGTAENFLLKQNFESLYLFRPGYIYPVEPRVEPNFSYRLSRKLYPLLKVIMPNGLVTSKHLAGAIFKTGINGGSKTILENKDILAIN